VGEAEEEEAAVAALVVASEGAVSEPEPRPEGRALGSARGLWWWWLRW